MALVEYFKVARVGSWLGWIFSFSFGSICLSLPPLERFLAILSAFSLATASIFVLNQYFDRKEDRENLFKSSMPIASEQIAPRMALIFSLLLIGICLVLVVLVDINLLSLFIIYLMFGTAYSAPPLRLKSIPVVDFTVSGIGAGFMPFLMGLELTSNLGPDVLSIMLGAVPLVLIHCGGHIVQAVGDYEVDRRMRVQTFVVRYGRKKGVIAAGLMFLLACTSPFIYSVLGVLSYSHLTLFFILFPVSMPILKCYVTLLKEPSPENVLNMQKTATKYGIIGIIGMLAYTLLLRLTIVCPSV